MSLAVFAKRIFLRLLLLLLLFFIIREKGSFPI